MLKRYSTDGQEGGVGPVAVCNPVLGGKDTSFSSTTSLQPEQQRQQEEQQQEWGVQQLACKEFVQEAAGLLDEAQQELPITNYQMALSKQGAGGGSATHKEPT